MRKTYQIEKDNYEDAGQASRDIKMTLKLIKMNENAIDKSLLKIKKAANFDCFF